MAFTDNIDNALFQTPVQALERWKIVNPFGAGVSGTAITDLKSWNYDASDDQLCASLSMSIDNEDAQYSDENSATNPFMMGTEVELEIGLRYSSGAGAIIDEYDYLFRGHIVQVTPANQAGKATLSVSCDDNLSRFREGQFKCDMMASTTTVSGVSLTHKGGGFMASPNTGWSEAPIPKVESYSGAGPWAEVSKEDYEILYGRGQVYFYEIPTSQIRADYGYYSTSLNVTNIIRSALEYPTALGGAGFSGAQISLDDTQISLNRFSFDPADGSAFDALNKMYNEGLVPINFKVYHDATANHVKGAYVAQKSVADYNVSLLQEIDAPRSLSEVFGRVSVVGKVQKPQNLCQASGASITPLSTSWHGAEWPWLIIDGNKDTQYVKSRDIHYTGFGGGDLFRVDLGKLYKCAKVYLQLGDDGSGRAGNVCNAQVSISVSVEDTASPTSWMTLSPSGYKQTVEANHWLQLDDKDFVVKTFRHVKATYDVGMGINFDGGFTGEYMSARELRVYESDEVVDSDGNYPAVAITNSSGAAERYRPGFNTGSAELVADIALGATSCEIDYATDFTTGNVVRFWNNDENNPVKEYRTVTVSGAALSWDTPLENGYSSGHPVSVCYDFYVPNLYNKIVPTYGLRTKIIKDDSRQTINDCEKRAADYLWEYIRSFQAMTLRIFYDPRIRLHQTLYVADSKTATARGMLVKRIGVSNDGGKVRMTVTGVDYNFNPSEW